MLRAQSHNIHLPRHRSLTEMEKPFCSVTMERGQVLVQKVVSGKHKNTDQDSALFPLVQLGNGGVQEQVRDPTESQRGLQS